VLILPENYDGSEQQDNGGGGDKSGEMISGAGGTIQVNGQDFVLQPGQELPAELQEMVARGLPLDFSNYELIIQEGDDPEAEGGYVLESQQQQGAIELQHVTHAAVAPPPPAPSMRTIR